MLKGRDAQLSRSAQPIAARAEFLIFVQIYSISIQRPCYFHKKDGGRGLCEVEPELLDALQHPICFVRLNHEGLPVLKTLGGKAH